MKHGLLPLLLCFVLHFSYAQTYTPTPQNLAARKLFEDMRFGMFIHWGASSILGDGEWVMNNRNIHVAEYHRLQNVFNPQAFDAQKWVAAAKGAGMKYITFVSRHHDSFSNWDTQQSDWKITNTPYGKDVLKQLADECRKQGIKLFLYYSILDWFRSDYQYETGRTGRGTGRTAKSDWDGYIRFMKAQLTELLTNYGEISGIWFDGHWDQLDNDKDKTLKAKVDWHYDEIYGLIHKLQPHCLIGNNHHLQPLPGEDFQMFERDLPGENSSGFGGASISSLPLETCETMNGSWGFNINDRNYKSTRQLIQYIVGAAGRNANFLLNVGPMPNGAFQAEFTDTLQAIGRWMRQNGEAYYGTRGNIIPPQEWGVLTGKNNALYAHIFKRVNGADYIFIPGIRQKVAAAHLLSGKVPVRFKQQPEGIFVYLDKITLDDVDTIVQLDIKQ